MNRFSFPATLTPDLDDGGFVVTFRDLPEAITQNSAGGGSGSRFEQAQGDTIEECLAEAADCLEEAIAARIDDNLTIPMPSKLENGDKLVSLSLQMTLKSAVYLAMREAGVSAGKLAEIMNVDEKVVQSILDPGLEIELPAVERVLTVLGKRVEIQLSQTA